MPIQGRGWELLITRQREDDRNGRRRTVGKYQVFHDGQPVRALAGVCAETRGPGDNSKAGNNRRVEAGSYALLTQAGKVGILIHPGRGFLSSVGCINPAAALANAKADIDFVDSRTRVVAIIDDMKAFVGAPFPKKNGQLIPNTTLVIDGEPTI
jgi:hypothetical protein